MDEPGTVVPKENQLTKKAPDDDLMVVCSLTSEAIQFRGQPRGYEALEKLTKMCQERKSFSFEKHDRSSDDPNSVVAPVPGLLPLKVTKEIFQHAWGLEERGLLSTNPDSVDGLPSFHLNLISGGKPVVPADVSPDDFQTSILALTDLVTPYVYSQLLPKARELLNSTDIQVSDVFLRRYGQDVMELESRRGISAHYDVFSFVTAVIALDDVAAEGTNGLYTTYKSPKRCSECSSTSNHAALRRFFPLSRGDGVLHTWDVLHGVDVEPGIDRTSLIVWFTKSQGDETNSISKIDSSNVPGWLYSNPETVKYDDVTQFVLGSAIESTSSPPMSVQEPSLPQGSMQHTSPSNLAPQTTFDRDNAYDLYLDSASRGNAFALTRLGGLCADKCLSNNQQQTAETLLDQLASESPVHQSLLPILSVSSDNEPDSMQLFLAKRFWLEGALRGSPLAQLALADEVMLKASISGNDDARLLAAVLFGLAAQQGHDQGIDSLARVVQYEVATKRIETEQDFADSPVVQVATQMPEF